MNLTLIDKYKNWILAISLTVLLLLTFFFSTSDNLRVDNVNVLRDGTAGALVSNNGIIIEFSRPITQNQPDIKSFLQFNPEITLFESKITDNTVIIQFEENLLKDTQYTLSISPGLQDIYSKTLSNTFEFSFKTDKSQLLFLRDNTLILTDFLSETIIYTSETIEQYIATDSGKYIFILEQDDFINTRLLRYSIETSEIDEFLMLDQYTIQHFDLDYTNNLWLLLADRTSEHVQFAVIQEATRDLDVLNDIIFIDDLDNLAASSFEFSVNNVGEIQIQTFTEHVLTDAGGALVKPTAFDLIGLYDISSKSYIGHTSIFEPPLNSYSEIYQASFETDMLLLTTVKRIESLGLGRNNRLIYTQEQDIPNRITKYYSIKSLNKRSNEVEQEYTSDSKSYENIAVDGSTSLLAFEEIEVSNLLSTSAATNRSIGNSIRPKEANILVVDIESNYELKHVIENGYNPVWVD